MRGVREGRGPPVVRAPAGGAPWLLGEERRLASRTSYYPRYSWYRWDQPQKQRQQARLYGFERASHKLHDNSGVRSTV